MVVDIVDGEIIAIVDVEVVSIVDVEVVSIVDVDDIRSMSVIIPTVVVGIVKSSSPHRFV